MGLMEILCRDVNNLRFAADADEGLEEGDGEAAVVEAEEEEEEVEAERLAVIDEKRPPADEGACVFC